jgi:hypothetical protein
MARNTNVSFKSRLWKRKTNPFQIVISALERTAEPYGRAKIG